MAVQGRQRAQGGIASRRWMQKCERVQQWLPPKRNKVLNDRAACTILENRSVAIVRPSICATQIIYQLVSIYIGFKDISFLNKKTRSHVELSGF